ncbi:MAG: hypothetical protein ABMB14_39285, partial [Myxococcota bacterium]
MLGELDRQHRLAIHIEEVVDPHHLDDRGRVHLADPERERVDVAHHLRDLDRAAHRDVVGLGHAARQQPGQVDGLVHPTHVAGQVRTGDVARAVQERTVGVVGRRLLGRADVVEAGREDDVAPVGDHLVDHRQRVRRQDA